MNPENSNKRKKAYDSTNDDPGSIDNVSNRQVYVGGISWNCDEQDIKDEFSTVGEVSNVRVSMILPLHYGVLDCANVFTSFGWDKVSWTGACRRARRVTPTG